jgi:hypothetical protein
MGKLDATVSLIIYIVVIKGDLFNKKRETCGVLKLRDGRRACMGIPVKTGQGQKPTVDRSFPGNFPDITSLTRDLPAPVHAGSNTTCTERSSLTVVT